MSATLADMGAGAMGYQLAVQHLAGRATVLTGTGCRP